MFETTNQCLICIIFQYWGAQFLTHTQMFLYVTKLGKHDKNRFDMIFDQRFFESIGHFWAM
jgi:hypothetical protein